MYSVQTLRVGSLRDDGLCRGFRANRAGSRERVWRIRWSCANRRVNGGTAAAATRHMARIEPWTIPLLVIMGTTFLVGFIMVLVVALMR